MKESIHCITQRNDISLAAKDKLCDSKNFITRNVSTHKQQTKIAQSHAMNVKIVFMHLYQTSLIPKTTLSNHEHAIPLSLPWTLHLSSSAPQIQFLIFGTL